MINYEKLAVLGAGESGVGAALLAIKKNKTVFVSDYGEIKTEFKNELVKNNIPFEEKGHDFDRILNADLIVKSPGISDQVELIVKAKALKIPVVSEIEFASWYNKSKLIAVTGSNGKTTTVSLIHHVLKALDQNVTVCGNIGPSFARALVDDDKKDYMVVEISSFQLDNTLFFKPNVGILLNITEDHLDRYNYNIKDYASAKLKLFKEMDEDDIAILNKHDQWTQELFDNQKVQKIEIVTNDDSIFDTKLIGDHNQFNIACALAALESLGFNRENCLKAISTFKPVKHRLEFVGKIEGVSFINDSKATNVDSVKFALEGIDQKIIWIAGGVDKGNNYELIKSMVKEKVQKIVCLTTDDTKIREAFKDLDIEIETYKDMYAAVKDAYENAERGEVVLLSPACASFDLFNNYEHRGDAFCEAVRNLMN
jgi:UDP-N-acetylmuramoylalanine--D-glutamate ligase